MEPLVIFCAGLVLYCSWISWCDVRRDRLQPEPEPEKAEVPAKVYRFRRSPRAAVGRGGGAAARWREQKAGSA